MRKTKTFALTELQKKLQQLGIPFFTSGVGPEIRYAFKSMRQIEPAGIYFLTKEISKAPQIKNSIVLCQEENFGGEGNITLQVENPQLSFYRLMEAMVRGKNEQQGIHPTAIVGADCEVSSSAYIGPFCVLEDCVVMAGAKLHSHVTVMSGTTIEENVTIEPHSTIGATGLAWVWDPATRRRVIQPQIGFTRIERGSFLGSDITVVRGSVNETTIIGKDCVIAHGSKIGHGSHVGAECHFANNISIAGNVTLGRQCFLGSGAVVRPQTHLAERTVVGAGAVVVKSVEEPDLVLMGNPAKPMKSAAGKISGVPKPLEKTKETT